MKIIDQITAVDITMEICGILMTNGSDLSQIDSSARTLCKVFNIRDNGIFVSPSHISISYIDLENHTKTEVRRFNEKGINLKAIEDACSLIDRIVDNTDSKLSSPKIYNEISKIKNPKKENNLFYLLSYIGVAVFFTIIFGGASFLNFAKMEIVAFGLNMLIAAVCSIIVFCFDVIFQKSDISDVFSKSIMSFLVAIVLLFFQMYIFQNASIFTAYILMGNIMLIVPGIRFTNGIRDMFMGDVSTAITHVISAIFSTLGMVFGILIVHKIFQNHGFHGFVSCDNEIQLKDASYMYLILSCFLAGFGTIFFSWYFHLEKKHFMLSFLAGSSTWFVYVAIVSLLKFMGNTNDFDNVFYPNFFASLCAALISEIYVAREKKLPSVIYLFPAIVSLIPGGALYKALEGVINPFEMNDISILGNAFFAAMGISSGILIETVFRRVPSTILGMLDKYSSNEERQKATVQKSKINYDEAIKMYHIAKRNHHGRKNMQEAYEYHETAAKIFERAINEINEIDDEQKKENRSFLFDYYYFAGINQYWMYKCAKSLKRPPDEQINILKKAKEYYEKARNELDSEDKESSQRLFNWMAVMDINSARCEHDKNNCLVYLDNAEQNIKYVLDLDSSYAMAHINFADIYFMRIKLILGLQYEQFISSLNPLPDIKVDDQKIIASLLININKSLLTAIYIAPDMPNAYYKMIQLQSYKICYYKIIIKSCSDPKDKDQAKEKIEKANQEIEKANQEAEEWISSISTAVRSSDAYLWISEEYYQYKNPERAKVIHDIREKNERSIMSP